MATYHGERARESVVHFGDPSGETACGLGPGEGKVDDTATKRAKQVTCKKCRKAIKNGDR